MDPFLCKDCSNLTQLEDKVASKNSEEHSKISGDLYNEDSDGKESSFNPSESTKRHNKHAKKLKQKKRQ